MTPWNINSNEKDSKIFKIKIMVLRISKYLTFLKNAYIKFVHREKKRKTGVRFKLTTYIQISSVSFN